MRRKIANNTIAFGTILFLVGLLIIVFTPTNLTIFTRRILGPPEPIGAAVSLVGLVLVIAVGYSKTN
ncbi:MAG: hypothetical protein ACETVY_01480 [Candidatus Bathyarchaeia archaeon]